MFDKYFVDQGGGSSYHEHNVNVKIQENRAPTDDSMRLLNELKEKAWRSILETFYAHSNTLTIAGCVAFDPANGFRKSVRYKLVLNGEEIIDTFEIPYDTKDHDEIIKRLIEHVSNTIAVKALKKLCDENKAVFVEMFR